jgi:hypothetical protein
MEPRKDSFDRELLSFFTFSDAFLIIKYIRTATKAKKQIEFYMEEVFDASFLYGLALSRLMNWGILP